MFLFPKIMQGWSAPPMDFSVAVWVGFIACFGMATETGIIMLVYLREAIEKRGGLENIKSLEELRQAVIEGAAASAPPQLLKSKTWPSLPSSPWCSPRVLAARFSRPWLCPC